MVKLLIVIGIVLLFIIVFSLLTFLLSIFPLRTVTPITPLDIGLDYEEIQLKTNDNIKLAAWFIPQNKSDKVIVVSHGYPFDKGNVLSFAPFLHPNYNLLFFDFRAMGKSGGKYTTAGYKEINDFNAAVDYLNDRGFKKIGTIGFSLGASTAIMADNPHVKAIVADSPYANLQKMVEQQYSIFSILKWPFVFLTNIYGRLLFKIDISQVSPALAAKNSSIPILLIHGKNDNEIPVENSEIIHKANPKNELWILDNVGHGQSHFVKQEEYEKKVLDFFDKHLK